MAVFGISCWKFRRTVIIPVTSEHGGHSTARGFTAQVKGVLCFFLPWCYTFTFIHISGTFQERLEHTVAALALYDCTVSLRSMPRKQEEECRSPSFPSLSSSLVFQSEPWFLETSWHRCVAACTFREQVLAWGFYVVLWVGNDSAQLNGSYSKCTRWLL